MLQQAAVFQLSGTPLQCVRYGNGHINETYLLTDSTARRYILQKVNRKVFRDPPALMGNIAAVTGHLRKGADSPREVLTLVPTRQGALWHVDDDGELWRLYDFIGDSLCLERAEQPADFGESAAAFGRFQRRLADFPAAALTETIPGFHDTPARYRALRRAAEADSLGRVRGAQRELEFALEREGYAPTQLRLQAAGELPLRVTHNDTKLNNVLFDRRTRRALCVIDLDTVMPGLAGNDFGDAIRFGASTAPEDERDLDRVRLSLPLFEAFTAGFLSACGGSLTPCEILHLRDGAKMMTLECGVRFLTDHLAGDTYFKIHREGHNLDRARTQFQLVAEMERHWDQLQSIVLRESGLG